MAAHEGANQSYFEDGIRLLEVTRKAGNLYRKQDAWGRRRLLDFLLSNSSWKDGELRAEFRQPFEMVEVAAMAFAARGEGDTRVIGACFEWRGRRDSNSRPPA
jgi:site-specific DNA recombinase